MEESGLVIDIRLTVTKEIHRSCPCSPLFREAGQAYLRVFLPHLPTK